MLRPTCAGMGLLIRRVCRVELMRGRLRWIPRSPVTNNHKDTTGKGPGELGAAPFGRNKDSSRFARGGPYSPRPLARCVFVVYLNVDLEQISPQDDLLESLPGLIPDLRKLPAVIT
jgi:hypothetical protein